jgi:hypothetical protein
MGIGAFVASGPYRWVRNPMYVGGAAVILGAGLLVASPAIVLLAFGFLGIMHLFVVLHEEPALTARFGASYEQYRASVRRWRIRRPASAPQISRRFSPAAPTAPEDSGRARSPGDGGRGRRSDRRSRGR